MATDVEPPDALALADIETLEMFRRSPHPYHRRRGPSSQTHTFAGTSSTQLTRALVNPSNRTISDEDGRKRRKRSQSLSESGTEADDEGYGFIKALPAPPIRPRKGLRDPRGSGIDGGASPLLTSSQLDEEARRFSAEFLTSARGGARGVGEPSLTDEEAKKARQKYLKRRRNELVRRTTETALLGVIGALAVKGCGCWAGLLHWHRAELVTYVLVMGVTLILYPLRLLNYSRTREPASNSRLLRKRIRIPAAFDPAPILYPTILPVLITISLFSSSQMMLLPNILLGLAALPSQLIPYGGSPFSPLHWLVSVLPLIASEHTDLPSMLFPAVPYKLKLPPPEEGLDPEILVSLFALHQALLPPLHYLTTTSLLPAELHLFSISLINLYLFADSPQANIPKALLWFGGVGVFVLCGKVLKWGVALARIPRWRFRRAGQVVRAHRSFLQLINESIKSKRSRSAGGRISDSDADEDDFVIKAPLKGANLQLDILSSVRSNSIVENGNGNGNGNENGTLSAIEPKGPVVFPRRRNTLPCLPSPNHITRRRSKSVAQSFLSLTPTQATVRKWVYACYFYLVVVVMILGPIRYLIGKHALHDHEPFGWAIGYLFGNIQHVRFQVWNWDLNWWIPLPSMLDPDDMSWSTSLGRAEHLRRVVSGEANVRLLLCMYCASIILLGLVVVFRLTAVVEVDTRRKVFHGMMVAMLLPTIYIDPCFVALALSLVLAIFLLLDLIRASQLPPLSRPLAMFLTPYVDGRDLRGPVVVSHIFLLIGCAIPLWLSLAGTERTGQEPWVGWDVASRDVSMISGVVCVGMGDAAASLIGRRYGRRKWPWAGGKSVEGSTAFTIAVTLGLVFGKVWLALGGWSDGIGSGAGARHWAGVVMKAMVCAAGASLNEAVLTGGNDNVVVPVVLWVLVRGVKL
ncbi:hypothetical protein K504DRAFT_466984 [Pleomassaria siparia CBS 279.74]|uniref:dolichol kinase n=1 Tax=Pleomassaria siparia CBS 279.74 TaxID=1314801 RepID=A0A6G1KCH7_9PLEO|nr:hypothetical protein K504DRAFT_466984 [Pleomassaria siparia CBS 279.74]